MGNALLGRVVNSLGEPIDGKGPIAGATTAPIEMIKRFIVLLLILILYPILTLCALCLANPALTAITDMTATSSGGE